MSTKSTTTSTRLAHCNCGCGNLVRKPKSLYAPGHDARHVSLLVGEIVDGSAVTVLQALPSQALRNKAVNVLDRMAAKGAAKAAKAEAKATVTKSVEPVKVGRWTYPAMRKGGVLLRNTKRDGSGEWVAV